jgi:hypothetical protein
VTLSVTVANSLWARSSLRADREFRAAISDVEGAQRAYLISLLEKNADSEYGRRYHFSRMRSVRAYQRGVPVTEYEDYGPSVERIAEGRRSVLTAEDVLLFEPTSGTTSGTKFIPYTASLRSEFQKAIGPWVASLFRTWPELVRTKSYWSISPPGTAPERLGKVRVGFEEDTEYLGRLGRWVMSCVSAVPPSVAAERDMDAFRVRTLSHLVSAADLGLASVWNPTFLTILLDFLLGHADEVLRGVRDMNPARADEVSGLMREDGGASLFQRIWPELKVVSCWTDGPSRPHAESLHSYLPQADMQGKGLLATEAFVTLPYVRDQDPVLAAGCHFFEFEESGGGELRLAHELDEGGDYSVVVTTGGGFYRYRLHDRVRVTGRVEGAPTMRFIGKDNVVVDLFGEKLALAHVAECLRSVFDGTGLDPAFSLLAPDEPTPGETCYTLYLACREAAPEEADQLGRLLDALLRENFHYDHCRKLGQLSPVRVFLIDESGDGPAAVFTSVMAARGMRLGDIKPAVLDREKIWSEKLPGTYAVSPSGATT